jgi:hypothetical protein
VSYVIVISTAVFFGFMTYGVFLAIRAHHQGDLEVPSGEEHEEDL